MFSESLGSEGVKVWRIKQQVFDKEGLKRSVKFVTSVIVCSCMTAQGSG